MARCSVESLPGPGIIQVLSAGAQKTVLEKKEEWAAEKKQGEE